MRRSPIVAVALAGALAALACGGMVAQLAGAEQVGGGGVVASLDGVLSPKLLPRHRSVPVSITVEGSIRADDGGAPPRLGRLEIAFARGGLDTGGLPRCARGSLRNATARQALARCRAALVGRGTITAEVPLNPERPLVARARVLAFNGRVAGGGVAIWVHAYSASPPVSFVLPFYVRRLSDGAFGFSIGSPVAQVLGRWPRLRSFAITLGRRYRAGGSARSYLSADCPLPTRLDVGFFSLARATYDFIPGPTHTITIERGCRVRD